MFCMEINEFLLKGLKHQGESKEEGTYHEDIPIHLSQSCFIPGLRVCHLHSIIIQGH